MSIFKKEKIKIVVIQNQICQGEIESNLKEAYCLFQEAIQQKPRLVCFTQAFATGVNFIVLKQMAQQIPEGDICQQLISKAREHQIYICAGILELASDGFIYDSVVLINDSGQLIGHYRRYYRWGGEVNYISQGRKIDVINTPIGRIGLLAGYDICFPDAVKHYFEQHADILIHCGAIFQDLACGAENACVSRAFENHCYFISIGALGYHQFANMNYRMRSQIIADPYYLQEIQHNNGKNEFPILAKAEHTSQIITADIMIDNMNKYRNKFPFFKDYQFANSKTL